MHSRLATWDGSGDENLSHTKLYYEAIKHSRLYRFKTPLPRDSELCYGIELLQHKTQDQILSFLGICQGKGRQKCLISRKLVWRYEVFSTMSIPEWISFLRSRSIVGHFELGLADMH